MATLLASCCTQASDELRNLDVYFREQHSKGRPYVELYELVQHAGNVVPRLYLLCTVGACYIRSKEAPAKVGSASAGHAAVVPQRQQQWSIHVVAAQHVCCCVWGGGRTATATSSTVLGTAGCCGCWVGSAQAPPCC